jgi:hypothetical protein
LTRKLRKSYEKDLSKKAKTNPKAIWSYIKSKTKTRTGIGDLHVDPKDTKLKKTDEDSEKAEILGEFFSSVFTKEPEDDTPTLERKEVKVNMLELKINRDKVTKLLMKLKVDKSPGLDNLHPRFMKETAETLSEPLTIFYNQSLRKSEVPSMWRSALISAIFKKGNKCQAGNYRPVSHTSVACKVLESLVREHIIEFMKRNNFFTKKPSMDSYLDYLQPFSF